jgi:PAS domain S-box-containing protein
VTSRSSFPPIKLLVVDAHVEERRALAKILAPIGCTIVGASSAIDALRHLLDEEFALAIVDMQIPELSGIDLVALVRSRERTAALPILLMTARGADDTQLRRGYRAGAADWLVKPFVAEVVRAKVVVFVQLERQRRMIAQQAERAREVERVELALASERRYRGLAESLPNIIWTARADGEIDYVNRRWFEYTGLDSARGGSWADALYRDDREAALATWRDAVMAGEPRDIECRLVGADGAARWHLCRAVPERSAGGSIVGWFGSFTDIDDERRALASLGEFKGTLDAELDAVMIFAPGDGRLLYANRGTLVLLGYARGELESLRASDVLADIDAAALHELLAPLRDGTRTKLTIETTFRRHDDREIPVEVSLQLISIDGARLVAIARDITDRLRQRRERELLYREAVDAIRARDEFLSVASHELRTPLSALQLQLEMLLHPPRRDPNATVSPEQLRHKLAIAARQVDRLARLIGELLDVSRITAGRLRLERDEADLAAIVRGVVERLADEAERARSPIEVRARGPVTGVWDRARLAQVAANLLSNACRFGAGKPIEVTVEQDGAIARLVVADHGIGIARGDIERIFSRYEQAVAPRAYGGLGLGLYIVRGIVEAHGGTIRVDSELGAGSRFVIELPRTPSSEDHAGHAPDAGSGEEASPHR